MKANLRHGKRIDGKQRQALNEKGRKNLHEGIRLAKQDFMREIEQIARDDTLPGLSPEDAERLLEKIRAAIERVRQEQAHKK